MGVILKKSLAVAAFSQTASLRSPSITISSSVAAIPIRKLARLTGSDWAYNKENPINIYNLFIRHLFR